MTSALSKDQFLDTICDPDLMRRIEPCIATPIPKRLASDQAPNISNEKSGIPKDEAKNVAAENGNEIDFLGVRYWRQFGDAKLMIEEIIGNR